MPAYRGARREMVITADPSKVVERDQIVRGEVEVWAAEKRDGDNRVINQSERWIIECKIAVAPRPATLSVPEMGAAGALVMRIKKNAPSQRTVVFANTGEQPAEISLGTQGLSGLAVEPARLTVPASGTATVTLSVPGDGVLAGKTEQEAALMASSNGRVLITVPILLRAASLMDSLKSLLGR